MLVDSLAAAQQIRDRLDSGEPFVELSREVSRAPNADTGGGLGLLSRGTLPEELDSVVFSLAAGDISDPVASPAGYHVFQVLEVVPEGPPERAEVELAVKRELADQLSRDFTRKCVASTAIKVGVAVYPENLWFDYQGRYGESANDA
jgi:parvulin-like peptidyl-prolyl isomerase